ncbi:hypothetical protein CIPAW_12G080000 [Carya illinoinensis]|uniref:Uncharacterized protein n=1 Tax=Carya illinoinensis TaxID=32201 RepID=A0A8T1NW81_CARIL|nr:hypothetical protein CIPAW_12G080000 [Carya illinoinensis]KAG6633892.1 hypothetical protein CIPAW_12G080000 [Carya illinoinensis]
MTTHITLSRKTLLQVKPVYQPPVTELNECQDLEYKETRSVAKYIAGRWIRTNYAYKKKGKLDKKYGGKVRGIWSCGC